MDFPIVNFCLYCDANKAEEFRCGDNRLLALSVALPLFASPATDSARHKGLRNRIAGIRGLRRFRCEPLGPLSCHTVVAQISHEARKRTGLATPNRLKPRRRVGAFSFRPKAPTWRSCRSWARRNLGQLLCLLSGVKRTSSRGAPMSAFDPKRTFGS